MVCKYDIRYLSDETALLVGERALRVAVWRLQAAPRDEWHVGSLRLRSEPLVPPCGCWLRLAAVAAAA